MSPNPLRSIPSVNELLEYPAVRKLVDGLSHHTVGSIVRTVLDEVRNEVQNAASEMTFPSVSELADRIARRVLEVERPALQPVINATGILFHPCLGRAPLAEEAIREMEAVARDYASVGLDLATGQPARPMVAVENLLKELTGAEAVLVVNNNAGATLLAMAALAAGREVIVSRGQLADLGDGYCLPSVLAASGAVLREVGATNVARLDDYQQAVGPQTAALMLVHLSDYAIVGATASVSLGELVELGHRRQLPVIHNLGAGAILDPKPLGLPAQPVVAESIKAGADLVLFSGDKLLGGPQCGIIVGRRALIQQLEKHPLARALRAGKLTLAALGATLRLYQDPERARRAIPILELLSTSVENLQNRAERLAPQIAATSAVAEAQAIACTTHLSGSPLPDQSLATWCIAVKPASLTIDRLAAALRAGIPPVVGRVHEDRLLLDLRSVFPRQDVALVTAFEMLGKGN
jgi:L-seryl-tRNA(Ser) seleniumtransferase